MNFYQKQAQRLFDDIELSRKGLLDAATLSARAATAKAAAAVLSVEIKTASAGQLIEEVRGQWRSNLNNAA